MQQTKIRKEYCFFSLLEKFISDSKKGKRLQPNGKKISTGTITNYFYCKSLLKKFCEEKSFHLRFREERRLNRRELEIEKNFWKKFYKKFTDYLYDDLGYFDNYVGQNIKIIKAFFNYLNKETTIRPGNFHKLFYVSKEEIAIFPLMPEELNYLIYNKEFEQRLPKRLKETKDVFVFGCTVALRFSDLLSLHKTSVRIVNGQHFLGVRSQKTRTDTLIKLPKYCVDIILKYKKSKRKLLPAFNKANLNKYIKVLLEEAGFTHQVSIKRDRRGRQTELKQKTGSKSFRFCDVASTHTMRRTAITTMLCLGMPEQIVRKISGHSPGTKEFYRYVLWAQTYQDQETDKVFKKLESKELRPVS
jgi:integrase